MSAWLILVTVRNKFDFHYVKIILEFKIGLALTSLNVELRLRPFSNGVFVFIENHVLISVLYSYWLLGGRDREVGVYSLRSLSSNYFSYLFY